MTMDDAGRPDVWTALESALADPELLDASPGFADRVMARIAAVAQGEPATWPAIPEALQRRGMLAAMARPLWLCATAAALVIWETWQAWAAAWPAIRDNMLARPAPGNNGAGT